MDLVISGHDMAKRAVVYDYTLDAEWGLGLGNDFELSCSERVFGGDLIWCPGTEYGGIVDADNPVLSNGVESIRYTGSTWHGILEQNVLEPDAGESHLSVSGDCNAVIASLLERCGLGEPFRASSEPSAIVSHTFPRYCGLYTGLLGMLASVGKTLGIVCSDGSVELYAADARTFDSSDGVGFNASRGFRPVNHLTVLGKGELEEREVIELYADDDGEVSDDQTLFGLDHRGEVYELSNEEGDELRRKGVEKLEELQASRDEVKITVPSELGASVGDVLTATSAKYGVSASATATGVVLKVSGGKASSSVRTNGKAEGVDYG